MPDAATTAPMPDARRSTAAQVALLAWRRTALEVGVISVVAARLVADRAAWWALVLGCVGVMLALAVHASAGRAFRNADDHGADARGRNLALTSFVVLVGLVAAWWVLAAA